MDNPAEIKLQLLNIHELLRSPGSSYNKRTLKTDAEDFLVEEGEALPRKAPIIIKIQLAASEIKHKADIAPAIQQHFCYRREQAQKKYKGILQYGWTILFIALSLLAVLFSLTGIALRFIPGNRLVQFIRESFIILGWVALWRPLELLLYDWYPVKKTIHLYSRLEHSTVQVIINEV